MKAALAFFVLAQAAPSKEHALLRSFVGEWEAKLARGAAFEPAGVETGRLLSGGYWLALDLRGRYEDKPYEGHGLIGYDPKKKMYAGVWVGSASPGMSALEGEADPSGRTLTMWIDVPHPKTGALVKERMVHAFDGPGRRTLTFYGHDEAGREHVTAVMTYTLRGGKSP
ncbi:MAG TPA: DUF1579 family protein [Planctomycetota bacterium]